MQFILLNHIILKRKANVDNKSEPSVHKVDEICDQH